MLLQPWIADFAAYNFWIRPLGLYSLSEWLWERGVAPLIVDCLSPYPAPGRFKRTPVETPSVLKGFPRRFARYGISDAQLLLRLERMRPFDAVLITSGMSYWYPGIKWAISCIRRIEPRALIILGGIYATLWTEHAKRHSGADVVLPGTIRQIGERLSALLDIPSEPIRTKRPWYRLGLHDGCDYAGIRTTIGCPFKCTYCASRILSEGDFIQKTPDRIIDEIAALYDMGVRQICFYDDALLVDFEKRLLPVLEYVVSKGLKIQFHTPNGLHARFIDKEVSSWLKKAGFSTIRLSLETIDPDRQAKTGGKVLNQEVNEAVARLLEAGIPRNRIGIYLLIGLPRQDLREVFSGIRFVRSLGIRPYLAEFSPIPGTVEWKRLETDNVVSPDMDPLLTNNTVFFRWFSGYSENQIEDILRLSKTPTS